MILVPGNEHAQKVTHGSGRTIRHQRGPPTPYSPTGRGRAWTPPIFNPGSEAK